MITTAMYINEFEDLHHTANCVVSIGKDTWPPIDDLVRQIVGIDVFDDLFIFGTWLKPDSSQRQCTGFLKDAKSRLGTCAQEHGHQ